jgi:hypothetical protein
MSFVTLGILLVGALLILVLLAIFFIALNLCLMSVPFVPVATAALPSLIDALRLSSASILYDLGSGDGKVLIAAYERYPEARYIGIEKHFVPYSLARWKLRNFHNPSHIELIHGSFFDHDLSSATHVFVYLLLRMLDKLLPKFEKELKKGTRLVSCDFQFSRKQPSEMIDIPGAEKRSLSKKIYVYEF